MKAGAAARGPDPPPHPEDPTRPRRFPSDRERRVSATQSRDATCRFTLAVAYARAARFDEASRVAEGALGIASAPGQAALAADIRNALARFAKGRPFEEAGAGP